MYIYIYVCIHVIWILCIYMIMCVIYIYMYICKLRLSIESSIYADIWAMNTLATYQQGKLIQAAWLNRGLVSMENIARWIFNGDEELAAKHFKHKRGELRHLMRLNELTVQQHKDDMETVIKTKVSSQKVASTVKLKGELTDTWCIETESSTSPGIPSYIPLPDWLQIPITRSVSIWHSQMKKWEDRIQKHCSKSKAHTASILPPKQLSEYTEFKTNGSNLTLLVNKNLKQQLISPDARTLNKQKDDLILLTIKMSNRSEEVSIRAGDEIPKKLLFMRGIHPGDCLPDCLNVPAGSLCLQKCVEMTIYILYVYIYTCKMTTRRRMLVIDIKNNKKYI